MTTAELEAEWQRLYGAEWARRGSGLGRAALVYARTVAANRVGDRATLSYNGPRFSANPAADRALRQHVRDEVDAILAE